MSSQEICELVKAENGKPEVHIDQTSTTCDKPLLGQVLFDFGQISHPTFGQVHVKGKFSRLLPRVHRPMITADDLKILVDYLEPWVNQYFDTALRPKYFKEIIECTCVFAYYIYPHPPIDSLRMHLNLQLLVLLWILDDIIEPGATPKFTLEPDTLDKGLDILLGIFQNDNPKSVVLDNFPLFAEIYRCAVDINCSLREHGHSTSVFCKLLEKFFDSTRDGAAKPVIEADSEETFYTWRKIDVFGGGTVETCWLLECDEPLPPTIFDSDSFQRLLDLSNGIGACTNDLLGLGKDLKEGVDNNLVIFKASQKKIPMDCAIAQVCDLLNTSLDEYLILKNEILDEFSNHPTLLHYIEVSESTVHEHAQIYFYTARYSALGQVSLCE